MKKQYCGWGIAVVVAGLVLIAVNVWAGCCSGASSCPMGMGGSGSSASVYKAAFTSVHFSGSGNCKTCHNGLTDAAGTDVSIEKSWSSTMMANATRDPLWRAKVRSELDRNPALADVLNSKCSRCHAPMANTEAVFYGNYISIFSGGFLDPSNLYYNEAIDGVSCTLCHQIQNSPLLGTPAGFSGAYTIGTYTNPADRPLYGPFANVATQPMRCSVQYTPTNSGHIQQSQLCATCHNLKTPYVDENGAVLSTTLDTEFPEQMSYSEWQHSAYATQKSCQNCHMPQTNGVAIASMCMGMTTKRNGFGEHWFTGGNLTMLDLLNVNQQALGVTGSSFSKSIAATNSMLQGSANIQLLQGSLTGTQLAFRLKILSNSGHKLPTGIPLRRIVLHVLVKDANGQTVFESGRINSDGSIAGVASELDNTLFEPHHELITLQNQAQIYETIMKDSTGAVTYTLLRAKEYAKDNRLLPAGFDKATAGADIAVVGDALGDANFQGGSDQIGYQIGGLSGGKYAVTAELIYQPLSYPALKDLIQSSGTEITTFKSMYGASAHKSTVMSTLQFQVSR